MTRLQHLVIALALFGLTAPTTASAFCGFYVTGADTSLYANATMTVLMREGTRTVLSMQNNYQGPPEAFALVIPVPMVLQKEQVKTLPKDVFQRVDALSAPRLVEYWEIDPCRPPATLAPGLPQNAAPASAAGAAGTAATGSVKIEAQFTVGEYEVVILSADDSSALDGWLRENKYNIPSGAEPVLMPYVAAGMKFFVAKVNPSKVQFDKGQAVLSPLRFYYDTQEFSLPVRLGLLNSQGSQDLIVNILAPMRYELANYPNITVPTNIRVQNEVRNDFGAFYEALISKVYEKQKNAVITEYSWSASSCDPCPTPPLQPTDLATLGADVLQSASSSGLPPGSFGAGFTLTRLHARYTKDSLGEDLVFKLAPGIAGGQGIPDRQGLMNQSVSTNQGSFNSFQGRYVILHPWEQELTCQNPQRGFWGGPSGTMGSPPMTMGTTNAALKGTPPKAGDLQSLLAEQVPSLGVAVRNPLPPLGTAATKPAPAAGSGGKPSVSLAGSTAVPRAGTGLAAGGGGTGTVASTDQPGRSAASSGCGSCSPGAGRRGDLGLGWLAMLAGALIATWLRRRSAR
ncbi:MAG TPA: DUF2330 domain-containing protein [Polyangiales bacterium]|nr:DUF2330 domain-containing protein [Polyangiales bacterium]